MNNYQLVGDVEMTEVGDDLYKMFMQLAKISKQAGDQVLARL